MCRDGFREWCGECGDEVRCRDDFPVCDDCLTWLGDKAANVTQVGRPLVRTMPAPPDLENW